MRGFRRWRSNIAVLAAAPSLGAGVTVTKTSSNTVFTDSSFTPVTGSVLLVHVYKSNQIASPAPTYQVGAVTLTQREFSYGNAQNRASVWMGTGTGVATGSAVTTTITGTGGSPTMGRGCWMLFDLVGWGGSIGGHNSTFYTGVTTTTPGAVTCTLSGSQKLLVGVTGAINATSGPFTVDAGWINGGSVTSGTVASSSIAMDFWSETGGVAAGTGTITPTAAVTHTDFCTGILELV